MKTPQFATPSWSTACFGDAVDTSPMELSALNEHLQHCNADHGLVFRLRCAGEALNRFVTKRLVTTLTLLALPVVVLALLL